MPDADSTSIPFAVQPKYEIRDLPGFPGYRVDTLGQVWTNRYLCRRQVPYDPTTPYRLRKLTPIVSGHLQVAIQRNGREYNLNVHRLVLEAFVGPQPPGMECRHLDGNPANNRIENLVWGTRKENFADRTRHGVDNAGERNHRAKLTDAQVIEIRQRYAGGGVKQAELAAMYGVRVPAISNLLTGKTYVEAGGPVIRPQTCAASGHRNAKLTAVLIAEIYQRVRQPGVRHRALADEYGVSEATISRIRNGYTYKQTV